jgi:hypothetical protein
VSGGPSDPLGSEGLWKIKLTRETLGAALCCPARRLYKALPSSRKGSPFLHQGRRTEEPGETWSSSPHPSSSKPPAPGSGSPAIRTPSTCASSTVRQPSGAARLAACHLRLPRLDEHAEETAVDQIHLLHRSRIHLKGESARAQGGQRQRRSRSHACTFICRSASSNSAPRQQRPSSSSSSSSSSTIGKEPGGGDRVGAGQGPKNTPSLEAGRRPWHPCSFRRRGRLIFYLLLSSFTDCMHARSPAFAESSPVRVAVVLLERVDDGEAKLMTEARPATRPALHVQVRHRTDDGAGTGSDVKTAGDTVMAGCRKTPSRRRSEKPHGAGESNARRRRADDPRSRTEPGSLICN